MVLGFISGSEIIIIFLVILLLFGADKIPEIARGLGKGMREFRKITNDIKKEFDTSMHDVKKDVDDINTDLKRTTTELEGDMRSYLEDNEVVKDLEDFNSDIKSEIDDKKDHKE